VRPSVIDIIALIPTPFSIARQILEAGIYVVTQKPLVCSTGEDKELIALAC
jgi:predicted dehydrogenase